MQHIDTLRKFEKALGLLIQHKLGDVPQEEIDSFFNDISLSEFIKIRRQSVHEGIELD